MRSNLSQEDVVEMLMQQVPKAESIVRKKRLIAESGKAAKEKKTQLAEMGDLPRPAAQDLQALATEIVFSGDPQLRMIRKHVSLLGHCVVLLWLPAEVDGRVFREEVCATLQSKALLLLASKYEMLSSCKRNLNICRQRWR
jgi:hypothetical protein